MSTREDGSGPSDPAELPTERPPVDPASAVPVPDPAPFSGRDGYERRRLTDAARLLPVLAAVLFFLPILWAGQGDGSAAASTARGGLYLFGVWALLIGAARLLSMALARSADGPGA